MGSRLAAGPLPPVWHGLAHYSTSRRKPCCTFSRAASSPASVGRTALGLLCSHVCLILPLPPSPLDWVPLRDRLGLHLCPSGWVRAVCKLPGCSHAVWLLSAQQIPSLESEWVTRQFQDLWEHLPPWKLLDASLGSQKAPGATASPNRGSTLLGRQGSSGHRSHSCQKCYFYS